MMPFKAVVWFIGLFWAGVLANVTLCKIRSASARIGCNLWAGTSTVITVVVVAVALNKARVI
jgi:hypothetical protein